MTEIDAIVSFWLQQPLVQRFRKSGEIQYKALADFLGQSGCAKNSKDAGKAESVQGAKPGVTAI